VFAGGVRATNADEELAPPISSYPYTASPERAAKIRAGAAELRRCMKPASIMELLGAPDVNRILYGKRGHDAPPEGSYWVYYLAKKQFEDGRDDARVVIFFDTMDRIRGAQIVGIPGVSDVDAIHNEKCS
jgi:hypothetical protein